MLKHEIELAKGKIVHTAAADVWLISGFVTSTYEVRVSEWASE